MSDWLWFNAGLVLGIVFATCFWLSRWRYQKAWLIKELKGIAEIDTQCDNWRKYPHG